MQVGEIYRINDFFFEVLGFVEGKLEFKVLYYPRRPLLKNQTYSRTPTKKELDSMRLATRADEVLYL